MRIDRDELICGVRPVLLKKLLARDRFGTLTAMADLGLDEPDISRTLLALESEGWIDYSGAPYWEDQWKAGEKALRLVATRLIKRFPIREGRRIVKLAVEEARRINADPECSCRITEIILFGSVLMGADDGDAGDIDLIVGVNRRLLNPDDLERITDAEKAVMPESLGFFQRLNRTEQQLRRRIKKISNKIALHYRSDLEAVGAPHRTMYAYDKCGHCGCALVAEEKKGRYVYYHCTGYRQKCPEPYVRQERLEEHFADALAQLDCGTSAFSLLQREVFRRYGDRLADAGEGALRRHIGLRPIRTDAFAEDGIALLDVARTAYRSLPALSVTLKHQLLELLFAKCSWANGELTTTFKRPFDRFHHFAVECVNDGGARSVSRVLDRLVDDIVEPPTSIKLLIARYNAIARLQDEESWRTRTSVPLASAA